MGDGRRDGRTTLREIFAIARAEELEPEEKILWTIIRSYQPADGRGAYPGDELLASHMGRSVRSIQEYRASLLQKGWLRRQLRGPKPAYWWAVFPEASQPTAEQKGRSSEADRETTRQSPETDCETSPEASQPTAEQAKASQEDPQPAAPEYGENNNRVSGLRPSTGEAGQERTGRREGRADPASWSDADRIRWLDALPDGSAFPARHLAAGVQGLAWRGTDPPPKASRSRGMSAELGELKRWAASWEDAAFALVGLRVMAERGDLSGVEPGEGFGLGYLRASSGWPGRTLWSAATDVGRKWIASQADDGVVVDLLGEGAVT